MGPCIMCGDCDPAHLEFNHIDPKLKTNTVSNMGSIENQLSERLICNCMCKKCHCIHTMSQRETPKERKLTDRIRIAREFVNSYKISLCGCQNPNCKDKFDPKNLGFYDFDHMDFRSKLYNISNMVSSGYSIKYSKRELEKCMLLCSYCHRLKTTEDYAKRREYYTSLDRPLIKREKKEIKITEDNAKEIRTLYNIENWSTDDISQKFDVSRSLIRLIINNKSHVDISYVRTKDPNKHKRKMTTEMVTILRDEYNNKKMSYSELAEKYNIRRNYVDALICNRYHHDPYYIRTRIHKRSYEASKNTKIGMDIVKQIRDEYNNTNASFSELAKKYGVSEGHVNLIISNKTRCDKNYTRTRQTHKINLEIATEIRDHYNNKNVSVIELAKKYDISKGYTRDIISNNCFYDENYTRTRQSKKVTLEIAKEIRDEYNNKNISTGDLAKKYNVGRGYVGDIINNRRCYDKNYSKTRKSRKITMEIATQIRDEYNNKNMTSTELAKKYNITREYVNSLIANKNHCDPNYIRIK